MVTIISVFALITGLTISFAQAKENSYLSKAIGTFSFGVLVLLFISPYFTSGGKSFDFFSYLLLSILTVSLFLAVVLNKKTQLFWTLIPFLLSSIFLISPTIQELSYLEFNLESSTDLVLIASLAALTPILIHLLKLLISSLIIRFATIKWADNEDNYLEAMVAYLFIGGVAALGNFIMGPIGLVIASVFFLSSSLISQNKLGLKNDIMLTASASLFTLAFIRVYLYENEFNSLNFLSAEVLEGAFIAGFIILFYDLMIKLARFNQGKTKLSLYVLSIIVPTLLIGALGGAYLIFERLGGILTLAAMLLTMALLNIILSLFKNSSIIGLKLLSIGLLLLITPAIRPVEQERNELFESLTSSKDESTITHETVIGTWQVDEDQSKIFFELGPEGGRTKGEFKTLNGHIHFSEDLASSEIDITIPVNALTTYISPRDKELMGDGYFKADEYPTITYTSSTINKNDDNYTISGDFTMLGVTKELDVSLTLLGKKERDGKEILLIKGSAEVDRTSFGMSPSSKIGNVVDFEFEVQLLKK